MLSVHRNLCGFLCVYGGIREVIVQSFLLFWYQLLRIRQRVGEVVISCSDRLSSGSKIRSCKNYLMLISNWRVDTPDLHHQCEVGNTSGVLGSADSNVYFGWSSASNLAPQSRVELNFHLSHDEPELGSYDEIKTCNSTEWLASFMLGNSRSNI